VGATALRPLAYGLRPAHIEAAIAKQNIFLFFFYYLLCNGGLDMRWPKAIRERPESRCAHGMEKQIYYKFIFL